MLSDMPMHPDVSAFTGAFDRFNLLHIQWHIGNYCNYRCSYCNDGLRDGTKPFIDIDKAKAFVTSVTQQAEAAGRQVEFTISGGEPTVYPDLVDLLTHMHACEAFSHVITNGSRSVNYYRKLAAYLTHGAIFTYHVETAKLPHFLEVVQTVDPRLVTVYIPMHVAMWDQCVEAYNALTEIGIRAVPKTIFEDFGSGGLNTMVMYSKEERKFIADAATAGINKSVPPQTGKDYVRPLDLPWMFMPKNLTNPYRTIVVHRKSGGMDFTSPQNLIVHKGNDFRGMKCNAGIEFLLVGFGGAVAIANCRPYGEVIANINVDPCFKLPTEPITCDVKSCWCEGDLLIKKFNP